LSKRTKTTLNKVINKPRTFLPFGPKTTTKSDDLNNENFKKNDFEENLSAKKGQKKII